jgi:hypothetical protein
MKGIDLSKGIWRMIDLANCYFVGAEHINWFCKGPENGLYEMTFYMEWKSMKCGAFDWT